MCQCRRSLRKSWRLLLVRSSATLGQASGDSTGGRRALVGKQIVDGPVPQIQEKIVEVIKVILREQCQRVLFFFLLTACGTGHSHTRGLILCASDGIWNMLFSTCSHTLQRVRSNGFFFFSRVCLSCRGSGFCNFFELFASFVQLCVVGDDHVHSCQ